MADEVVNLEDKLALFDDRWSPKIVAEINDLQVKLVKVEGEFVWHELWRRYTEEFVAEHGG